MPAQFFTATDDKPTGTAIAYKSFTRFMARNLLPISPAIASSADIQAAIGELWDGIGPDLVDIRADITGPLNADASELEIAILTYFILREKFQQYGTTLPGGGGP